MTIAICTRNRAFILGEAMDSLIPQIQGREEAVELLVVDNASDDGTRALVERRMVRHPFIRYVHEPRVGLSIARNTAWQSSPHAAWIFYMDDDAKACPDLVEQSLRVIVEGKYDCFGGTYYAWFPYGKPKWWPEGFGNKSWISDHECFLDDSLGFLSGGIMALKRNVLLSLNGFNENLGMNDKTAYGEDNEIQKRISDRGLKVGYLPSLFIHHAVLPHKHKILWHIYSYYKGGYASQRIYKKSSVLSNILKFIYRFGTALTYRWVLLLIKVVSETNYYWQNAVIDLLKYFTFTWGCLMGQIKISPKLNR